MVKCVIEIMVIVDWKFHVLKRSTCIRHLSQSPKAHGRLAVREGV
jgi:hypothetical protein